MHAAACAMLRHEMAPDDGPELLRVYTSGTTDQAKAACEADRGVARAHGYRRVDLRWDTRQPSPTLVAYYVRRGRGQSFLTIASMLGRIFAVAIGLLVAATLLAVLLAPSEFQRMITSLLPDQRVESERAGFALDLPPGTDFAMAATLDPEDWWNDDGDIPVERLHQQFIEDGGLMVMRTPSFAESFYSCQLADETEFASSPPAWDGLQDAERFYRRLYRDDEEVQSFAIDYHEFAAGMALSVDVVETDGFESRDYLYTDGESWFELACATDEGPPDDRWLSIARSFEILTSGPGG